MAKTKSFCSDAVTIRFWLAVMALTGTPLRPNTSTSLSDIFCCNSLSVLAIIIPIAGLAAIFAVLPVFLSAPIMMLEPKDSLLNVIKRAFSLGYKKWGALILISLIMGLVGFLLNNATTFPLGMLVSLKELLVDPNTGSVFWSFVTDIATYVLCVAGSFISFIEMGLFIHAITCHYGSVTAEVEDIDLDNDIDNFAQLK